MAKGSSEIIATVAAASGLSVGEVEERVRKKKEKFSGLLEERSAAYLVARELGIEVESADVSSPTKIAELKDGSRSIDLIVRAMHIFPLQGFERQGKKGVLRTLLVADETGEARLTLWHEDAKKIDERGIERGTVLLLKNCYITTWQSKPQINLAYGGRFSVGSGAEYKELPKAAECATKLRDLKADMSNVDVYGKVMRVYGKREFERGGRQGAVLNFEFADETAAGRAAAWNEHADEIKQLEGEIVKIEGAYTKDGLNGVELNLGWQARVLKSPQGVKIESFASAARAQAEEKKIAEIDSEGIFEIKGRVSEIYAGNLRYFICPKCGKKAEGSTESALCARCGEVKAEPRLFVGFVLENQGAEMRCVAFGADAEKVLGMNTKQVLKRLNESLPEEIADEARGKTIGREARISGRVKQNDMSCLFEMLANSVEIL